MKNITTKLNKILADIHVLTVKLHNYHWNVSGLQFHSIHEATEAYYDYFFGQYDDVAERILQLGDKPLSTAKAYLEVTGIKEEEATTFDATFVLKNVLADFVYLLSEVKEANAVAEENGDLGSSDLLGGLIIWFEKEIWILKSTLGE